MIWVLGAHVCQGCPLWCCHPEQLAWGLWERVKTVLNLFMVWALFLHFNLFQLRLNWDEGWRFVPNSPRDPALSCVERFSAWEEAALRGDNCSCLTTGNPPEDTERDIGYGKRIADVWSLTLTTRTHQFSSGPSRREPRILLLGFSHGRSHEMGCATALEYPAIQNDINTSVIMRVSIKIPLKHFEYNITLMIGPSNTTSKEHWYCGRWSATLTCVIEPPGLAEEMRGGGSGICRGRTAAILSCGCREGANAKRE